MGAVSHYIEENGIATTGISLVRENTVAMRPPRALWVPFDLGRPFGVPGAPEFQASVLRAVLGLLEHRDGPVVLEDFPQDAPGQGSPEAMDGMVCPIVLRRPARASQTELIDRVVSEINDLAPWYELYCQQQDAIPKGASGLSIKEAAQFLGSVLANGVPASGEPQNWGKQLRFTCEDLRNYYLSATLSRPGGAASPRAIADWFWGETSAGALILALHPICLASHNDGLRQVAESQLVPRAQRHRLS